MKTFILLLLMCLCSLAQDPQRFRIRVTNRSNEARFATTISTPIIAVTPQSVNWFSVGTTASPTLEGFAEDAIGGLGLFPSGVIVSADGPLNPGQTVEFQVELDPAQRLHIVSKFQQSNDIFISSAGQGIAVFDADMLPLTGDLTPSFFLYDAGTEINQEPGVGSNQPDRSMGPSLPNCSCIEGGLITQVGTNMADNVDPQGFFYDNIADILLVEITPTTAFQLDIGALTSAISLGDVFVAVSPALGNIRGLFQPTPTVADPSYRTNPLLYASSLSEGAMTIASGSPFGNLLENGDATGVVSLFTPLGSQLITLLSSFQSANGAPAGTNITVGPWYAAPGDRLHFLVANTGTTDRYYAPLQDGIDIFNGQTPLFGDVTAQVEFWDAGIDEMLSPRLDRNANPGSSVPAVAGNLQFSVNPFVPASATTTATSAASLLSVSAASLVSLFFVLFF